MGGPKPGKSGGPKGGAQKGGAQKGGRPKISRFLPSFPPQLSFFFLSWGPFVEFWWFLKRRGPEVCMFGLSGCRVGNQNREVCPSMWPSHLFIEQPMVSPLLEKDEQLQIRKPQKTHILSTYGPMQGSKKSSKLAQGAKTVRPSSKTSISNSSPMNLQPGPNQRDEARSTVTLVSVLRIFF